MATFYAIEKRKIKGKQPVHQVTGFIDRFGVYMAAKAGKVPFTAESLDLHTVLMDDATAGARINKQMPRILDPTEWQQLQIQQPDRFVLQVVAHEDGKQYGTPADALDRLCVLAGQI